MGEGDRVILHSGCVVGSDGFGFAPNEGRWEKIPQIGRVLIGDDVEVGACTTIDRGALEDTVIEEGVKLDNLIQVATQRDDRRAYRDCGMYRDCGQYQIGRHCMIGAQR